MREKHASVLILVLLGILLIAGAVFFALRFEALQQPETWRSISEAYPVFAPIAIVLIIITEVILAPIPGGLLPVLTGFLFGPFLGTLYSWSGNVIGSLIAWYLARTFGTSLVEKLVTKETLAFYDTFLQKRQPLLWVVYALPFFPIDILSLSIGLSTISFKRFSRMVALALLPSMFLLNYIGDKVYQTGVVSLFILVSAAIVLFLLYSFAKEWRQRIL